MLFWFSLLCSPTLIQIGMLGPIFGLSVNTSIILTVFATLLGSTVPAFTATLCPPTGLRQIAVARYSLGIWGAKFCGVLNIIVNIGYATISSIVGGELLRAYLVVAFPSLSGSSSSSSLLLLSRFSASLLSTTTSDMPGYLPLSYCVSYTGRHLNTLLQPPAST